jgi:hypothetical protein
MWSKMYICLHVRCPLFLSEFNELEFSRQIFEKSSNIKFHKNPSSRSWAVPCGRTNGRTNMTKLIVAFHNFCEKLLKSCNLNTSLSNGGFSLIHLRSVRRQCYCAMEISTLLSHWLMQFTWKKRAVREPSGFAARKFAMKNTGGIYSMYWTEVIAMLTGLRGGYTTLWMGQPSEGVPVQN